MTALAASAGDRFGGHLFRSAALHLVVLGGAAFAVSVAESPPDAPPSAAFIELGMSGPNPSPSLGGGPPPPPAPPPPEPEPEPEPEPPAPAPPEPEPAPAPAPEPADSRPGVARPTTEDRDRMPVPEARERRRPPREQPDSGLRGKDAAWARSARLAASRPLDTKSRPSRRPARTPAETSTGTGGIGLGGAPGGARFDQDFEYAYYQRQMIARIAANWQQIPVRGKATVVIRFTVHRDGSISAAEVETSSGQSLLDRSALRAVVLAEPLPRLPESYPRDRVGVHLLFTYGSDGGGSDGGPTDGDSGTAPESPAAGPSAPLTAAPSLPFPPERTA